MLGTLVVAISFAACATASVTSMSPPKARLVPGKPAQNPPLANAAPPQVGEMVRVKAASEGRWAGHEEVGPEEAHPGFVYFYPGAQRRVVRIEGTWTLLELYEPRYGQRGLAWIRSDALGDELVPLVVPPSTGELAYVSSQELYRREPSAPFEQPITRCGLHRVHAREHSDDDERTLVSQYESGVELRGWVLRRVPKVSPVDCRPRVEVHSFDKDTADLSGLIVLDEINLGREFLAMLRARTPLFQSRAGEHGLVCDALQVRRVKGGYQLRGPTYVRNDGTRSTWVDTVEPLSDGESFAITPWGENIAPSGRHYDVQTRCQSLFQLVEVTSSEVRTAGISRGRTAGGPEPYAVSPGATKGWYRSAEACEAAIAPLNRFVEEHGEQAEWVSSSHALSGGGC